MEKVLTSCPEKAQRILTSLGVSADTPDEQAIIPILTFFTDLLFHAPALCFARGWKGNAYIYHFNEGNPWEGPWKGYANHILDVAYLFQNFREFLGPEQEAVGIALAEDFLRFCHGVAPWPAITPGEISTGFSARVYGSSHHGQTTNVVDRAFGPPTKRSDMLFDHTNPISLDYLAGVFPEFNSQ